MHSRRNILKIGALNILIHKLFAQDERVFSDGHITTKLSIFISTFGWSWEGLETL